MRATNVTRGTAPVTGSVRNAELTLEKARQHQREPDDDPTRGEPQRLPDDHREHRGRARPDRHLPMITSSSRIVLPDQRASAARGDDVRRHRRVGAVGAVTAGDVRVELR